MIVTDTLDSQLMVRLLRRSGGRGGVLAYRRGVGWAIVALSFGIAGYAAAGKATAMRDPPEWLPTAFGLATAVLVPGIVLAGVRRPTRRRRIASV